MKTASFFAPRVRQTWRMAGVLAILCVLAAAASAHEAEKNAPPQQITVPGDVPTLPAAYKKIADGGTIILKPGHYKIPVPLVITKNIHIVGESDDPAATTVECASGAAVIIQAEQGSLQRLSLRHGDGEEWLSYEMGLGACIDANYDIDKVNISKNAQYQKPRNSCVLLISAGAFEVVACDVQSLRCGVIVDGEQTCPRFRECKFHGGKIGVFLYRRAKATFDACEFSDYQGRGLDVPLGCRAELVRCRISGGKGVGADIYGDAVFKQCTVRNTSRKVPAVRIYTPVSDTRFMECDLCTESRQPVVYRNEHRGDFLAKPVCFKACKIYGDFKEVDGEKISTSNFVQGTEGKTLFINGSVEMEDCDVYANTFGLVVIGECAASYTCEGAMFSTVTLRKCKFHGHWNTGVHIIRYFNATIDDCEFYENAEFGLCSSLNKPVPGVKMTVKNGKFYKNGNGAAFTDQWAIIQSITIPRAKPSPGENHEVSHPGRQDAWTYVVRNSEFYENRKTALECSGITNDVRDCSFRKNGTGLSFSSKDGVAEDCEMRENTVGVAMHLGVIKGCKIVGNKIGVRGYDGTLDTCAMTDNTHAGVEMYDYSSMTLKNSRIRGGQIGAYLADDAQLSLEGCEISGCEIGVQLHDLSSMTGEKVKIHQCSKQELGVKSYSGATLTDSTVGQQRWTGTRMFPEEEEADE